MKSSDYSYWTGEPGCAHAYLLPTVFALVGAALESKPRRIFDLGCGNGSVAAALTALGYSVVGVDPSLTGIDVARSANPGIPFSVGSSEQDLAALHGTFPCVVSLEVIEHVYAPRQFAARIFDLLEPGGVAIISTPFHGYWKNLALALTGRMDAHFTALWDNGHIKFWSEQTLRQLLSEAGFGAIRFDRVGRIRPLAKSMIAVAVKPG